MLLFATAALAQNGPYRLKPEDVIRIQVYKEADILVVVPVGDDGNISAPFVGTVRAQGRTTSELEEELRQLYITKLGLRDPIVSVTIDKYRVIEASVGGIVVRPGTYVMRPGDSVMTLLNKGGGVILDGPADLRRATLRRAGSKELIPIDLHAMLMRGDTSQNLPIEDGDELTIPEDTKSKVVVWGRVQAPGSYPYKEPMTVMDALAMARGEVIGKSKFSKVMVVREQVGSPGNYLRIECDIVRFLNKGDNKQNIALMPGDLVYVPDAGNIDFNVVNSIANLIFILDRIGLKINPFD